MIADTLLYLFAAIAAITASAMLVVRHPMRVALSLIVCMLSLAGIYALLGVHVLAVFQVLIYVGAVMVFMVYVIMLIDTRDSAFGRFSPFVIPAAAGLVALALVLGAALVGGDVPAPAAPARTFGVQSFSQAFLDGYWLYFELISVLLVAAVVAAIAMVQLGARRRG